MKKKPYQTSKTIKYRNVSLLCSLAATFGLNVCNKDVKQAHIQGNAATRAMYEKPAPEFNLPEDQYLTLFSITLLIWPLKIWKLMDPSIQSASHRHFKRHTIRSGYVILLSKTLKTRRNFSRICTWHIRSRTRTMIVKLYSIS